MLDYEMSLYYVLSNNFELSEMYKCPSNMTDTITPRPIIGSYFLISGISLILIYLPCFIVMLRSKCRAPSYQLMMLLGVFDLISLLVNSVTTGVLGIMGASFCHYPLLVFCAGAIGLGSWMGGCVVCILLAVDRCVEINSNFPLAIIFQRHVFRLVMLIICSYWVYASFFTKPLLFTAHYSSWFFDPNIGRDADLYHNIPHTINNLLVSASSTPLYIYLCYHLIFKFGYSTSMWLYRSKQQIIIQAVILCSFHAAAAYIYVYMQFFPSPPWLILIGQLAWQWSNGCVCIAYWTLNRTIRNSAIRMMLSKATRQKYGLHLGIDEQIVAERQEGIQSVPNAVPAAANSAKVAPFMAEW
ncbi:hypothetical protein GCK72_020152 [Caenorhabditis remanei]|uniref:Uncharacterized protein n=1 Tax=Caenorhabditis remanei TaxID=31234 RepID=A0A6A5GG18_CAERE|nr:hypothetical protein GCK72_020152 [Caenorhabditis remanei]KAF1753595.1 hypothetical protein GCK72_020152 [Caenorhabditis remanei]